MAKLRIARSLWTARGRDKERRYASFSGELAADVAIVGGGITGAAVAWRFADAGLRVAVLEADRVAGGSTAASTALLMQEPDKDLLELARRFGQGNARRIWRLSQVATRDFIRTLRRLKIRCELDKRDSVYYAITADAADHLKEEFRARRAAGLAARWLDPLALRRLTGIRAHAGIQTPGNAQVDPCKACLGLLRAAERRGTKIFE